MGSSTSSPKTPRMAGKLAGARAENTAVKPTVPRQQASPNTRA